MDVGVSRPLIDLRGMNAVVTGGSRGVGRATALLLARSGANVGIGYRSRTSDAEETVRSLEAFGVGAWSEAGDLASASDADGLFERSDREFDGLDIFVGNHGIWPAAGVPVAGMTDDQWHHTIANNLDSIFYATRAAARSIPCQ